MRTIHENTGFGCGVISGYLTMMAPRLVELRYQMREAGSTWGEIAKRFGITPDDAKYAV